MVITTLGFLATGVPSCMAVMTPGMIPGTMGLMQVGTIPGFMDTAGGGPIMAAGMVGGGIIPCGVEAIFTMVAATHMA